jgi:hypothetical protein
MNRPASAVYPRARSGFGASAPARLLFSVVSVFSLFVLAPASRAIQLIPGVYGYGTERSATVNMAGFGTGAQVIEVTSLADSGAGTFRDAVTKTLSPVTPRIVVFKISGVIDLKTQILMNKSNVTIAGQTAPYPGVAVHGAMLVPLASNLLVQHLRMRAGDRWYNTDITKNLTQSRDSMQLSNTTSPAKNVVFDHCTFGWSLDECVSGYDGYNNITFNKCLFAEPLSLSIHMDEGIFNPNQPQQAQALSPVAGSVTLSTVSDTLRSMSGDYQLVTANANGDYVDYTLTINNATSTGAAKHTECSVGMTGITGSDRGKFKIFVYEGSGTTPISSSNEMSMYAASGTEAQVDFIPARDGAATFLIPANPIGNPPLTYRVRVQVTAPNAANGGRNLGIDQFYIVQAHAMGPYFTDGFISGSTSGRLSMIGNAFAHFQTRGPWVGAQEFFFANNVVYDRKQWMLMLGVTTVQKAMNAAVIGNTFIEGKSWDGTGSPVHRQAVPAAGANFYVDLGAGSPTKNAYEPGKASPPAIYDQTSSASDNTVKADGLPSGLTLLATATAYADVILTAGARPSERDSMETRIFDDIDDSIGVAAYTARLGILKNSVFEAGDWPVLASNPATWTMPTSLNADDDGNGYTNVEDLLQAQSKALYAMPLATYPGESGTFSGGTVAASDVAGYHGSGFANFAVGSGGAHSIATYSVAGGTGGSRALRIRYTLGGSTSRTGTLVVNGVSRPITFLPTASVFGKWLNLDLPVTLVAGTNTIELHATGADLGNVDELVIY